MADEMDPCECLWNHELAMRRLISLLRQSQTYCTDVDCLEPSLPAPGSAGNSFMTMFLVMALAVLMYAIRPRRQPIDDTASKPSAHNYQLTCTYGGSVQRMTFETQPQTVFGLRVYPSY